MPKYATCLIVPKIHGEKAITLVNKLQILNKELNIQRNQKLIYIPLTHTPSVDQLKILDEQIANLKISEHTFTEKKKTKKTLAELLEDKLPPYLIASLPHAIDFIGDIAVTEIPPELEAYKSAIGEAILETHQNVRTVLAKAGAITGTFRLREFTIIAGEPTTETIHKEFGCQYHVDLAKAYYSPRLSHEHNRIASLVEDGETIVDLFAGVGPFSILIAKTHKNVKVYAVDVNPHAIMLLKKNVRLNRVENRVYPILGDAKEVVEKKLHGVADRVIMNLPEKAIEFVGATCKAIKPSGGIVHFYGFVNLSKSLEDTKHDFTEAVEKNGRELKAISFSRLVRATAPYEWQAVIDAEIH